MELERLGGCSLLAGWLLLADASTPVLAALDDACEIAAEVRVEVGAVEPAALQWCLQ